MRLTARFLRAARPTEQTIEMLQASPGGKVSQEALLPGACLRVGKRPPLPLLRSATGDLK